MSPKSERIAIVLSTRNDVRHRSLADVGTCCKAVSMNRWRAVALCLVAVLTPSCTRPVHVTQLLAGNDYRGLWHQYAASEVREFQWAAIDAAVPASVARSMRRWQLNNLTLRIFRCNDPKDFFPAFASRDGDWFNYQALKEPLPSSVTLTFYLPKHVEQRERYDCAALDARGYSPVFLRGQTMRLPALRFEAIGTEPRP